MPAPDSGDKSFAPHTVVLLELVRLPSDHHAPEDTLAAGTSKPYSAHWPLPLWYKPSYSRIGRYGTPCYTDPPAQMAPQTLSPSPKDLN